MDYLVNGLLRWKPGNSPIEIVAAAVSRGRGSAPARIRTDALSPLRPPPMALPDQIERYHAPTVTIGADATLFARWRIAVVPTGRLRWVMRPLGNLSEYVGVGACGFHMGVTARLTL